MQTESATTYNVLTLDVLRSTLSSPVSNIGMQFKRFVLENLSVDPNTNLMPWKNGTRWITVTDTNKNKATVCISNKVWQRAVHNGYDISNGVAIDVAITGLRLDKHYQVQIDAMAVRVSGQSRIEALRESIIKYCESKGYFDRPKKTLPVIVRNVAIITSQHSTVQSDITNQIGIKDKFIDAYRFDGSAQDLSLLIRDVAGRNKHDIVCLYRGGREDEFMFVYSDPIVLDEIVKCTIPVVSAIGHECDNPPVQSVVDIGFASPSKFATSIRQKNTDALKGGDHTLTSINHHFFSYLTKLEKDILLTIGNINKISSHLEQKHKTSAHRRNIVFVILISLLLVIGISYLFIIAR